MFGFGKKIGMTTLFLDEVATSVTALEFGEQIILQSKTKESDGYDAVQVSFGKRRKTRQSTNGHTQKYAKEEFNPLFVGEFKIQEED
jgi:large subunit ribosomal protein L3